MPSLPREPIFQVAAGAEEGKLVVFQETNHPCRSCQVPPLNFTRETTPLRSRVKRPMHGSSTLGVRL